MTLATAEDLTQPFAWPDGGVSQVPYRLFSDPEIYALEQQRIFRGPVWNFLCLEIDVKNPGDFKLASVGETPVVVTRDKDGAVHAFVNRCAHKGALVCLKERGNAAVLTCVYHSWSYNLKGELQGIAFRNGIKGKGGMPADFDPAQHRLQPLKVEVFSGLVFGTFDFSMPSVESYLGPVMAKFVRRSLDKPLRPLGLQSQILHNNWKLYAENVRDSYHATLLHTFYTTFKINRLDMDGGILMSDDTWHHISYAKRDTWQEDEEYRKAGVHSAQFESKLDGPQLLDAWDEEKDGISHVVQSIFPNLAIHFTLNSICVRFFAPRGLNETELFWFYLGVEGDTPEQERMRVLQGNLTGAAGLVSLEDGCINEFVQRGTRGSDDKLSFMEMGGRDLAPSEQSRATEVSIRGFWAGYRRIMGFQ
jgi:phenylpropionate dioxygenase-like ring-hydroxylating dioxygenase large terminal subunit